MSTISLDRNSPNAFVLVPHGAFSNMKSVMDQVWKLNLDSTDSHPFYLSTTYGLRAKSVQLFPNLIHKNRRIAKPEDFSLLPRVIDYSPASLLVEAEYQNQISFLFTFFFLEPEILTGNIQLRNLKQTPIDITLQLALNLVPMGKGQPSHPDKSGNNQFITGKTDQLEPVLFMTGGPSAINNPFPALSIQLELKSEGFQQLAWTLVSKETKSLSFERAKKIITSGWRETLRIHKMKHAGQTIDIKTENPNWDGAFFLSQVNAKTHLLKYEQEPDNPQFIKFRLPDQSSLSDNNESKKNTLTNLELNHLCQVILPSEVDIAILLLEKQIKKQIQKLHKNDRENNLPHVIAQKGCPLLGSLLLEIYEIKPDIKLLERFFPSLVELFRSWVIDPSSGTNANNLHWDTPTQLQIDSGLFSFDIWESYSNGLDIKKVESPALYAMLYKEAKALDKLSKLLHERSHGRFFKYWEKECQQKLDNCWQEEKRLYGYQDIKTHLSSFGESIFRGQGSSKFEINQSFIKPERLQCHIFSSDEHTRACTVSIKGISSKGEQIEEHFKSPDLLWVSRRVHLTTENLYLKLESACFEGLNSQDEFTIETADVSQPDITCLLPLWAGSGAEKHRKEISSTLFDQQKDLLSYGIPETWQGHNHMPKDLPVRVNILWNTLILEGLTNQGESQKAAELFINIMDSIVHGLIDYDGFYPLIDTETGQPVGQYNAISGLVPIRLFLKIAGIKLLSPTKVALWGSNPFPWPIKIHWKGLSLWKEQDQTKITFPNGATTEQTDQKSVLIAAE